MEVDQDGNTSRQCDSEDDEGYENSIRFLAKLELRPLKNPNKRTYRNRIGEDQEDSEDGEMCDKSSREESDDMKKTKLNVKRMKASTRGEPEDRSRAGLNTPDDIAESPMELESEPLNERCTTELRNGE